MYICTYTYVYTYIFKTHNTISYDAAMNCGGLYCDDAQFAVNVTIPPSNAGTSFGGERGWEKVLGDDTYALAQIDNVQSKGKLVIECATFASSQDRELNTGEGGGGGGGGNGKGGGGFICLRVCSCG